MSVYVRASDGFTTGFILTHAICQVTYAIFFRKSKFKIITRSKVMEAYSQMFMNEITGKNGPLVAHYRSIRYPKLSF